MRPTYSGDIWTPHSTGDLIAEGSLSIGDGYRAKNSELTTSGLPFARAGNIDSLDFSLMTQIDSPNTIWPR